MTKLCLTALVALPLALTACATMSESECASADWYAIGVEDGANGRSADRENERAEACFNHGFRLNREAYRIGRVDGLTQYCVPSRGYDLGESGGNYNGVCSGDAERSFLAAYEQGRARHDLLSAISSHESDLDSAYNERDRIDDKIAEFRREIDATLAGTGSANVDYNLDRIEELLAERTRLVEYTIPELRADLRFAEKELERFDLVHGY